MMELEYTEDYIKFDKELNDFDKFTLSFIKILDKLKINYVLISGYIALLFGRPRMTEDVDLFIEKISFETFIKLWEKVMKEFDCINTEDKKEAYYEYLNNNVAINFSIKDKFLPRMEVKFPKTDLDYWTLKNNKKVILNNNELKISIIELQIAYKVWLGRQGNDKDIEDAKFLYNIFKKYINTDLLMNFVRKLNIESLFKEKIR
jgi:hypothetical protein